jgi:hypothetical protein
MTGPQICWPVRIADDALPAQNVVAQRGRGGAGCRC